MEAKAAIMKRYCPACKQYVSPFRFGLKECMVCTRERLRKKGLLFEKGE